MWLKLLTSTLALVIVVWFFFQTLKKSDDPVKIIVNWILTILVAGGLFAFVVKAGGLRSGNLGGDYGVAMVIAGTAAAAGLMLTFIWGRHIGEWVAKPFTTLFIGDDEGAEDQPFYAVAEASRKRGLYRQAIAEILQQLIRFPDDFQGLMLLAEIYAENLQELVSAEKLIDQIVSSPDRAPKNLAFALNRLADWKLKFLQDRAAAQEALERIVALLPETEEAQLARQRLAHLTPEEMLLEKQSRSPIRMVHHVENVGLQTGPIHLEPPSVSPEEEAGQLVAHLNTHPHDYEAREKLALIYARHYRRYELAADQFEQLIATPHQPAKQVVHWLNQLADIQIELKQDLILARQTIERIEQQFPNSASAENARQRIAYLSLELKKHKPQGTVPMGTYPRNIGLSG